MRSLAVWSLLLAPAGWALQPPSALVVPSATNREVKLSWTAGGSDTNQYAIERRPLDSDTFSRVGAVVPDTNKVLATTFTDTSFDPFTAYVYRVRGVNTVPLPNDTSDPTNEMTVGPPPYGYTRVVPTPDKLMYERNFGRHVQMRLDPSGDPVVTWLVSDPNEDGDYLDSELWFLRWDRAHYVWTAPKKLATVGPVGDWAPATAVRVSVDSSTGAIGIVVLDQSTPLPYRIVLLDSTDGGATWRKRVVVTDPDSSYRFPSVALAAGKVHLSFYHDYDGIRYMTGNLADDPTTWSSVLVPLAGGAFYQDDSDVAVDSAGKPAVAYLVSGDDGTYRQVFYRPGGNATVANAVTQYPGDFWQIRLAFFGTNPRIAFLGSLDDQYFASYDHMLFLLASDDGGVNWRPAANVVSDGNTDVSGPIDLAFDSKGRGAIVTEENGGNSDGVMCGAPKLSLSDPSLNWKTCGLTATYVSEASSPNVQFVANDSMYIVFQTPTYPFDATDPNELPAGVYFWRGPVGFTYPIRPAPAQ